jgi:hypothetical protein
MNYNGYKPSAHSLSPAADTECISAPAAPYADIKSPDYGVRRQQRLAERLCKTDDHAAARWNHLITVVVYGRDTDDVETLPRTLGSLLAQHHRNIEVLVIGMPNARLADTSDFASCRGLFSEPDVDVLDLLSDPATDRLWRGSHLIVAPSGTEFDPDAVELLNAAVDSLSHPTAPALVLCDRDRLSGDDDVVAPNVLSASDSDVMRSLDTAETGFMVSRTLLLRARQVLQRPGSLRDWLYGVATMIPVPHVVHIAETLIHVPQVPASSRLSQGAMQ